MLSRGGRPGSCCAMAELPSLALPAPARWVPSRGPVPCSESQAGARVESASGTGAASASWPVQPRALGELGPRGAAGFGPAQGLLWSLQSCWPGDARLFGGLSPPAGQGAAPRACRALCARICGCLRVSEQGQQCGVSGTSEPTPARIAGKALGRASDTWVRFSAPPRRRCGPVSEGEGWG